MTTRSVQHPAGPMHRRANLGRARVGLGAGLVALATTLAPAATATATASATTPVAARAAAARAAATVPVYAPVLVDARASAVAMNAAGAIVGTFPGIGPNASRSFVYQSPGGIRLLPAVPGLPFARAVDINDNGWVAGTASTNSSQIGGHAVAWAPSGSGYQAFDLGVLPGTTQSSAAGIDAQNRVIGWSSTMTFPALGAPFLWTSAAGMVDLSASGAPLENPLDVSANGTVLVGSGTYRAGVAGTYRALPPLPAGYTVVRQGGAVNDSGDQIRVLGPPSTISPFGVFRLTAASATWTFVGTMSQGSLSANGLGNLDANGDFVATLFSTAVVGFGPQGTAQAIDPLVSPAYPGVAVTSGVSVDNRRQIAGTAIIGRSPRLVRLDPVAPCSGSCVHVAGITVSATLVSPTPGQCLPAAFTRAVATVTVVDAAGVPVPSASVRLTLLDDVSVSTPVTATADSSGVARITRNLPPCGGAVAVFVRNVVAGGAKLDRTVGELTDFAITTG